MPPFTPRHFMLLTTGLGVYATTAYASYHAYRIYSAPPPAPGIADPARQEAFPGVFDALAPEYDGKIGWDEWLMRVGSRRKELVERASGSVLEVSTGTGRNLEYYTQNPAIKRLTLTDTSEPMLHKAYNRFRSMTSAKHSFPPTSFEIMNVQALPLNDRQYDTVIDTFGLCSCSDPVAALREMARCCKPDGRVLLLEHGRGRYGFLNDALDKTATEHAVKWGCWWNRDIDGLVKKAGLEIVEMKTFHFGTTLWMVAKPRTRDV
ncbi:hypothetical protein SpCBS45565_g01670 [Spizellomyces sp. 'palustris']|nr:hypothetical protein SpCBS45565_g01670 [Spizellomyces sp. 'palustris']